MALVTLALASLPAGGSIPDKFLGTYALLEASKNLCDPAYAFSIRPTELRLRGTNYAVVMEETIDSSNVHLWIHDPAQKNDEVTELHLTYFREGRGSVVLRYDAAVARGAVTYGTPPADSGVEGLFIRCPAKFD